MVSWKLWRALRQAPQPHALYRRAYFPHAHYTPRERRWLRRIPLLGLFRNAGLIVLPVLAILLGAPTLGLLYYLSLLIAPVLLPLVNTLFGLAHVSSVSGRIARERDQQTYDVICTIPQGALGVHWSYSTGWLHYHALYRYALLAVLATGVAASLFGLPSQAMAGRLALVALFVFDYAQTLVLSTLVAALIPAYTENEENTRLWASSLFLLLQAGVYVPTVLLGTVALPGTLPLLGIDEATGVLVISAVSVLFFVLLRELIIVTLWSRVEQDLSGTRVELDVLTEAGVE